MLEAGVEGDFPYRPERQPEPADTIGNAGLLGRSFRPLDRRRVTIEAEEL